MAVGLRSVFGLVLAVGFGSKAEAGLGGEPAGGAAGAAAGAGLILVPVVTGGLLGLLGLVAAIVNLLIKILQLFFYNIMYAKGFKSSNILYEKTNVLLLHPKFSEKFIKKPSEFSIALIFISTFYSGWLIIHPLPVIQFYPKVVLANLD